MIETVVLHGGPMHGRSMQVSNSVNEIDVRQPIIEEPTDRTINDLSFLNAELPALVTRYTRVFNQRTPTTDFEWVGKVLP